MQFRNFAKTFLLVISIGSMANAHLIPGSSGDLGGMTPYPGGGGGLSPGLHPHPGHPHPGHPHGPPPKLQPRPPMPPRPMPPRPMPPRPLPPRPLPPPPHYPPPPPANPGYGTEVKRIYLNRQVMNEQLDLRAYAGLGYNYQGAEIVSVRANVRPSYRTVAQLVIDGRIVATQFEPGYEIMLFPNSRVVLDQSARSVMLSLSGNLWVDTIDVEVRSSAYNPGGNVEIPVYRSVFGNDRVDLGALVDLNRYRGLRIQQVIVTASVRYGSAVVSLLINGFNAGNLQFTGGFSQRQNLWLGGQPMIGSGADSLMLYTSGDMTIEHVTLVVR